jgi:hypothetical protein
LNAFPARSQTCKRITCNWLLNFEFRVRVLH